MFGRPAVDGLSRLSYGAVGTQTFSLGELAEQQNQLDPSDDQFALDEFSHRVQHAPYCKCDRAEPSQRYAQRERPRGDSSGDRWLQEHLDAYVQLAQHHNSLLIVTWDEDNKKENNRILTLFVGPMVQAGRYEQRITHYNVLRTLEDLYDLSYAGASAGAAPITKIWNFLPQS